MSDRTRASMSPTNVAMHIVQALSNKEKLSYLEEQLYLNALNQLMKVLL